MRLVRWNKGKWHDISYNPHRTACGIKYPRRSEDRDEKETTTIGKSWDFEKDPVCFRCFE